MKNLSLLFFIFVLLGTNLLGQSKFGEYKSYHFFINNALLDNKQYGIDTGPDKLHIGLGVGLGLSVHDEFNLLLGLNFMQVKPNNTPSDYSFCEDAYCLPLPVSNQLFLPIGIEYYNNTDQSPFQLFYALKIVPAFSVTEVTEVIPFNVSRVQLASYEVKNNEFKFQDLHVQIALNNEFSINQKYKIYVEPSISHSILFKAEDIINPDYFISLKIGFKIRNRN
ncbi:MAG: hypothetical protein ACJA0Q_000591 [Saprospiraceae bacterium]|jgi:hypothetical protein